MRAFILVDDADSMSEFSDELVILLTEPEEENEDFSSVLSSLPSLSSVYNKNENESKCVGIVFGDKFIPTKPKAGNVKEWMKKSVWGEAGMDKESKEMEEMIMKAIQEEKARMKAEALAKAMKIVKEEEARMEEEENEMDMKRQKIDEKEEVREAEKEVEVKEERIPEETKKEEVNTKEEKTDVKEESMEERTTEEETKREEATNTKEERTTEETKKEEEMKTRETKEERVPEETKKEEVKAKEETMKTEEIKKEEVKTTEEEEANAEKEPTQTEETEEAVVASEAKNPPTVSQNEEPNSFAAVNEETKTDEAEEGLPVQTEQSKELLRDCLGTIRQQINGVTVTLGLRMGDSASTCTLVVCRKGAYEKFFNMQKDDVPFTVRFMDKRYPFSVGVESSMKEVRQRAISVSSVSSPYE